MEDLMRDILNVEGWNSKAELADAILNRFNQKLIRRFNRESAYWLLLARFIQGCPQGGMKRVESRMQSKLIEANHEEQFTIGHMHFIRMVLKRCPAIKNNNQSLLVEVANKCANLAARLMLLRRQSKGNEVQDDSIVHLAATVYSRVVGPTQLNTILTTILALAHGDPPYANADRLLPIEVVKGCHGETKWKVIAFLWVFYAKIVDLDGNKDFELDLTCLASAFKATLSICDFEAIQRANSAILATAERVGIGLCRVMEFVVNGLMTREKLVRDEKVLKTLCRLNNLFGVSSTIHESFAPIASNLIDVMLRKEEALFPELANLTVSILNSSSALLPAQVLCKLQHIVCQGALSPSPSTVVLKLLNALLERNCGRIPLPLQVAKSAYSRLHYTSFDEEHDYVLERGKSICHAYSHPRVIPIPSFKYPKEENEWHGRKSEVRATGVATVPDSNTPLGNHQIQDLELEKTAALQGETNGQEAQRAIKSLKHCSSEEARDLIVQEPSSSKPKQVITEFASTKEATIEKKDRSAVDDEVDRMMEDFYPD